jgi:hypothetical protein
MIVGLAVVSEHAVFLYWVQTRLQSAREYLSEFQGEMRKLVKATVKGPQERSKWRQPSMYIQIGITLLLLCILTIVLKR